MKSAAIAELKASLSEYLRRVKAGEDILVTDRGVPVARIVPLTRRQREPEARLRTLEKSGTARIGTGLIPREFWNLPRPSDKAASARKALSDEREDGR